MRTVARHGVGGIFGRSSSVGAHVQGAATRYSANQRALPVLVGLGADWAPGQPTPDEQTLLAHGYYKGVDRGNQSTCSFEQMPAEWDCNAPNVTLIVLYSRAAKLPMDQFVTAVRAGQLAPPPNFPSLVRTLRAAGTSSNVGLWVGLGVAALALGGAVVVKLRSAA